jgi:hypothetical protein
MFQVHHSSGHEKHLIFVCLLLLIDIVQHILSRSRFSPVILVENTGEFIRMKHSLSSIAWMPSKVEGQLESTFCQL